jgi:hypothetical protein
VEPLKDTLLDILATAPRAMSVAEIKSALEARGLNAADKPMRGRLSELLAIGVVDHAARGQYEAVRVPAQETPYVDALRKVLGEQLGEGALRRTVLWDATPYLMLTEDGAPGARLVVEHAHAETLKDTLEQRWPGQETPYVWMAPRHRNRAGPLGNSLWSPPHEGPSRIDLGVLLVAEDRIGGTGLTQQGSRTPFQERILLEFLAMDTDLDIGRPIVARLLGPDFDVRRAWQCANALDVLPDFIALMSATYSKLTRHQQQEFRGRMPRLVQSYLGGSA